MVLPSARRPTFSLTVSSPRVERPTERPGRPALPWPVLAVVGSVGAVAVGWLAIAVLVSAAWLTAMRTPLPAALDLAGQLWLAVHFAHVRVADVNLSLVPTGGTLLVTAAVAVGVHYAGLGVDTGDAAPRARLGSLGLLVAAGTATYCMGTLVLASLVGTASQATAALTGALGISLVGSVAGAVPAVFGDLGTFVPRWLRSVPGAIGVGLAVLAGGSALALAVGLGMRWDQVQTLRAGLAPTAFDEVLLGAVTLAYLPTMLLWAGSYVLGTGITLGVGTVVTPGETTLGLLPAFPPLAAVPPVGSPLAWGWLWVGVAAGAASGFWFCRGDAARGGTPGLDRWPWQAALPGLAAATVWVGASWLTRGDLGAARLVGMGPIFPDLLWWTGVPLTVGAAASGLAMALWGARRVPAEAPEAVEEPVASASVGGDR